MKIAFKVTLNKVTNCWGGFASFYKTKLQVPYITCLSKPNIAWNINSQYGFELFPQGCLLSTQSEGKHSSCGRCKIREEKAEMHLLHHVRIKLQFCNYCVNRNRKQAIYCHHFNLAHKHNMHNICCCLLYWLNDFYLKEKASEWKGLPAPAAAGRKAEHTASVWEKHLESRTSHPGLQTSLQWKDREVTPI